MTVSLGNAICCPAVSYHKSFLGKDIFLHGNDEIIKMNVDWELFITLAKEAGEFLYSPKRLCHYRIHSDQLTGKCMQNSRREKEDRYCFEKIWPKFVVNLLMHFYKKSYEIY